MRINPEIDILKLEALDKSLDIGLKADTKYRYGGKTESKPIFSFNTYKGKKSKSTKKNYIDKTRNCYVKFSYIPNISGNKGKHKKALQYIGKEGKGINGEKPVLYGSLTEEEYEKNLSDGCFRIIISPEDNDIDLNNLTKTVIKKLEDYTNYKFRYIAANHYDTEHPHIHILIDNKDFNNRIVNFSHYQKGTIPLLLRNLSRNECTKQKGAYQESEIEKKLQEMIPLFQFTKLDNFLEKYIKNNELSVKYTSSYYYNLLSKRIDFLKQNDLCYLDKNKKKIIFRQNWKTTLQTVGKYNTFLDGYNYCTSENQSYSLHLVSEKGSIEGVILKKYSLKDSNHFAVLLKLKNNSIAYVPLNFYPKDFKINDEVIIKQNKYNKSRLEIFNNHI